MTKKPSQHSRYIQGRTWMTLWTYCCSLISSLVISTIAITPAMVSAETILPNDLSITKTLSGTVYPGATVETIINYHNNGPTELSGISITDSYSQYLSFDNVVVSNPDITVSPVEFSHDVALRKLTWNTITLGTGANGQIILRYIVSNSLPENTDVFNAGSVGISCVSCQDPYTVANTGFSVGYVNPRPLTPPAPYDLGFTASIPQSTYTSGDTIDITLDISNDTYSSGDVMLEMVYKTFLMEFVGIVNSGAISFPTDNTTHPNLSQNSKNSIYYLYNNGDTSKVRRHGFSVPTGTSQVVLRFKMINDYTTPINVDFNLGIPNEYNLISTIGETNTSNNTASITVQGPDFDLWTTTAVLTGDEVSPGVYSASGTITFRIEFGNNGPARDNIILTNSFNSDQFISYTGDRDYGLFITGNNWSSEGNGFYMSDNQWGQGYRKYISLGANETGYIDITYHVHDCGTNTNNSRISIIDNYKTQLQLIRPWQDNYLTTRARETTDANNISNINASSDGSCVGGSRRYDQVIGEINSNATGDLTPGQIITFTVPWIHYASNPEYVGRNPQLSITYSPWMSFVGLNTGSINTRGDNITESFTPRKIAISKKAIEGYGLIDHISPYTTGSREDFRIGWLSGIATNECNFSSFPTGRPNFDNATLDFFQYQQTASGFEGKIYTTQFDQYRALGYNMITAHLHALVDAQTEVYQYSYLHDGRSALLDIYNVMVECEGQHHYLQALQGGMTTGEAETLRQNIIDQSIDDLTSKDIRPLIYNICGGGDLSLFSNYVICGFGSSLEQQYYITGDNLYEREEQTLEETLRDAYATSLGVSGFQHLLGQRLATYLNSDKPLVRQYKYDYIDNDDNNNVSYCPDIICTRDYYNKSGRQEIFVDSGTYNYFIDQYLLLTGRNNSRRLSWSGGYIDLGSIVINGAEYSNNNQPLFIDTFTTTGGLAIGRLYTLPNLLNTIQLQFLIGEAPVGSSLSFEARIAQGSRGGSACETHASSRSYNQGCFYNNYQYTDTYNSSGGTEGDIIYGDDNTTGIVLTMGYREPYDLTITKTISQTGDALPGDIVDVTTTVCNNGTGRNDISLSEDYLPNMVFFDQTTSTLGVSYILDVLTHKIIWNNISLTHSECKSVTTSYTVQSYVSSGSQLIFNSIGGSLGAIMNANTGSYVTVTGAVTAPAPIIYSPYGNKEIVSSTFFPGDEIIYRINYSNPGSLTGIMNLYDMYESGLIFSGIVSSTQGVIISSHNTSTRIITWSGIVVEPYSSHSIELSFIISTGKNAFETIRNNFTYDMTFIPDSYIADADKSNNNSNWKASYSLNTFKGYIQHDTNNDGILDSSDKPLSGLEVQLIESGTIMATTLSDGSGGYLFTGMRPGIYTISYTMPAGYIYGNTLLGTLGGGALTTLGLNMVAQYNTYSVSSDGTVSLLRSSVQPNPPSDGGGGGGGGGNSAFCGNNIKEGTEQCDGGSMCTAFCTTITPVCSGSGCNPPKHNAPSPESKRSVKLYPIQEEVIKDEDHHMAAPSLKSFPKTGVN